MCSQFAKSLSVIFQSCIFQTNSFLCPSFSGRAFSASPTQQTILNLLDVPRFRLNTYGRRALRRFQLLARSPGTHSRILSGIQRAAQTVLGVFLKRTCSRVTSASSALGVLNDYALYKSTHSPTISYLPKETVASPGFGARRGTKRHRDNASHTRKITQNSGQIYSLLSLQKIRCTLFVFFSVK